MNSEFDPVLCDLTQTNKQTAGVFHRPLPRVPCRRREALHLLAGASPHSVPLISWSYVFPVSAPPPSIRSTPRSRDYECGSLSQNVRPATHSGCSRRLSRSSLVCGGHAVSSSACSLFFRLESLSSVQTALFSTSRGELNVFRRVGKADLSARGCALLLCFCGSIFPVAG